MEERVPESLGGERLDRALAALGLCPSRREARAALQRGAVFVGGIRVRVASRPVRTGDLLRVEASGPALPIPPVDILWESGPLLALNKPGGVPFAPTRSAVEGCLLHALARARRLPLNSLHPLHRLDTPTSGAVLVTLDAAVAAEFGRAFQERRVEKCYLAWVHGAPSPPEGRWEWPLSAPREGVVSVVHSGLKAVTSYRVVGVEGGRSLLALRPETGRTHQLRVHSAHAGFPIVGDRKYGGGADGANRALLHAWRLRFAWEGGLVEVVAPPPADLLGGLPGPAFDLLLAQAGGLGADGV